MDMTCRTIVMLRLRERFFTVSLGNVEQVEQGIWSAQNVRLGHQRRNVCSNVVNRQMLARKERSGTGGSPGEGNQDTETEVSRLLALS